jgi:hypothetical protein
MRTTEKSAPTRRGEGRGQRRPAPLLAIRPVERRRNGPGLARDIEQDRRDGAAEERAPVETGQEDDGRGRHHGERQGQQDRDPVGAAKARQHADDGAERDAHHRQEEIVGLKRDPEAEEEILEAHDVG